ncbi:MAG: glycosyl hydrolase [Planctomycetota bacterium]
MIDIDNALTPADLLPVIQQMWTLSAAKIRSIEESCPPGSPSPVFTVEGKYTAQGWTEWTQGFQYGGAALQFDATGEEEFLEIARQRTLSQMAPHLSHIGVHDHGFNNVSTYGNLLRLAKEGRYEANEYEIHFYELALKLSGAVQASRWSTTIDGTGYIYSFNGPQSLFVDTIRSCRSLSCAHALGHVLQGERDQRFNLLDRVIQHARNTARYNIWYGGGSPFLSQGELRDTYDIRGRTSHESVFNTNNGDFRCPSTQQGYSAFSTWTRGLAWAMLGFPEQLEFLQTRSNEELAALGGREHIESFMLEAACATCDFYIERTPTDGVPYWDTGAPNLYKLGDYLSKPSDPANNHEPVDSSAAAIACQGLIRLGRYLTAINRTDEADRYIQAGFSVLRSLLTDPYISTDANHQGLLLHAVYHWPNGWDHVPASMDIPFGESCMWGDYHLREAALYVQRLAKGEPEYNFFAGVNSQLAGATS